MEHRGVLDKRTGAGLDSYRIGNSANHWTQPVV